MCERTRHDSNGPMSWFGFRSREEAAPSGPRDPPDLEHPEDGRVAANSSVFLECNDALRAAIKSTCTAEVCRKQGLVECGQVAAASQRFSSSMIGSKRATAASHVPEPLDASLQHEYEQRISQLQQERNQLRANAMSKLERQANLIKSLSQKNEELLSASSLIAEREKAAGLQLEAQAASLQDLKVQLHAVSVKNAKDARSTQRLHLECEQLRATAATATAELKKSKETRTANAAAKMSTQQQQGVVTLPLAQEEQPAAHTWAGIGALCAKEVDRTYQKITDTPVGSCPAGDIAGANSMNLRIPPHANIGEASAPEANVYVQQVTRDVKAYILGVD